MVRCTHKDQYEDILGESVDSFVSFLVNHCLLNVEEPNKIRFKSRKLRELGFALLDQLDSGVGKNHFGKLLNKALKEGVSWRNS